MDGLEEQYRVARWISDELLDRLTEDEQKNLKMWRESSEQHEKEYKEIRARLQMDLQTISVLDPEKEWKDFQKHLWRKKYTFRRWYVAAAIIMIGVFSVLLLRQRLSEEPESLDLATIGHKTYKAILILNDGQKINIGDSVQRNIPLEKGVIVDSAHVVKYEIQQQDKGPVEYNTIVVPRGAEYEIYLADGTRVWLNSESQLTYPVCFNDTQRCVNMIGEVCFQVAKDKQKPFVVKAGKVAVAVLGTLFNIEAYPGSDRVITTLVEGKVRVEQGENQCYLEPNHQAIVENDEIIVKDIVATDYISWINGYFHFTEASLGEIMTKLARWYDVEFFFANPALEEVHFSLDIRRYENIVSILSKIEKTGRVHFSVNGKTVIIQE